MKMYVLCLDISNWEDSSQYLIRGYSSKELAEKHMIEAEEYLENFIQENKNQLEDTPFNAIEYNNPIDQTRTMTYEDLTNAVYWVEEIDFYL